MFKRLNVTVPAPGIRFARNKSWFHSLGLGLKASIWWAPTTLYGAMQMPIVNFLGSTGLIAITFTLWLVTRFVILIAGLLGMISLPLPDEDKPAT